jgi:hypothetical protein
MRTEEDPSIISKTTILILSGFLIGMSFAQPLGELGYYVFNCGLTGLIAWMTFELSGVRQDHQEIRRGQLLMEARLMRHVGLSGTSSIVDAREKDRLLDWLRRETDGLLR